MAQNKGVLIIGELADGKLATITLELLEIGRKLANDLQQELSALFIGNDIGEAGREAIFFGADKVYVIDQPIFREVQTEAYLESLKKLCQEIRPDIVLFGQTSLGKDLAPALAFELDTVATLDCIRLNIDPDTRRMERTKPVYGGSALAVYAAEPGFSQVATIRPKTVPPAIRDDARKGQVLSFDPQVDPAVLKTRIKGRIKDEIVGAKLEDAEVIICGGRGLGSQAAFTLLYELAKILKGAVGGTRPACDAGWLPSYCQIGLTGKLVSPTLYVGVALSGSSQHQAGMAGSKNIIVINKDPEANIFNIAHYGVVGDYQKVLPSFLAKCKELASK